MDQIVNNLPYSFKSTITKVKNAVMNYTDMEVKVMDATNSDAWGASTSLLSEIARASYSYQNFNEIMPLIYKRLVPSTNSPGGGKNLGILETSLTEYRRIYKSLILLEHLIKLGSERCVDSARDHVWELKTLTSGYRYVDDRGRDEGKNVRFRAEEIIKLINDDERLRDERERANKNKHKYTGLTADEVRYGSGFGGTRHTGYEGFSSEDYSHQRRSSYHDTYDRPSSSRKSDGRKLSSDKTASAGIPVPKMASATTQLDGSTATSSNNNEVDLLDLEFGSSAPVQSNQDDDFSDFQSAPNGGNVSSNSNAPKINFSIAPPPSASGAQSPLGAINKPNSPTSLGSNGGGVGVNNLSNVMSNAYGGNGGGMNFAANSSGFPPMQPSTNVAAAGTNSFFQPSQGMPMMNQVPQNYNMLNSSAPMMGQASSNPITKNTTTNNNYHKPQKKNLDDLLSSNLGELGSLGTKNPSRSNTGPALSTIAQQKPQINSSNKYPSNLYQQNLAFGGNNNSSNNNGGAGANNQTTQSQDTDLLSF